MFYDQEFFYEVLRIVDIFLPQDNPSLKNVLIKVEYFMLFVLIE